MMFCMLDLQAKEFVEIAETSELVPPDVVHVLVHPKDVFLHLLDSFCSSDELVVVVVDELLHLSVQCLNPVSRALTQSTVLQRCYYLNLMHQLGVS